MGVIENICQRWDVLYFSCRGYSSQSEMCKAAQRLVARISAGQKVRIIHLGDHDPSGKDMSRDIDERLMAFVSFHLASRNGPTPLSDRLRLERIALNMDQVRRYNPPPNPAKITDSRAGGYTREHGHESWELDALDKGVLIDLIDDHIQRYLDPPLWERQSRR